METEKKEFHLLKTMAATAATAAVGATTHMVEGDDSSSSTLMPAEPADLVEDDPNMAFMPVELFASESATKDFQKSQEIDASFSYGLVSYLRADFHRPEPLLTDIKVELALDSEKIYKFHKPVLASESGYFQSLLNETPLMDAHKLDFEIIDAPTFDALAESFYTGNVELANVEAVNLLLKASFLLQINHAESRCTNYLTQKLNIDNCLDIWLTSKFSHQHELRDLSTAKIGRHLHLVSQYPQFLELEYRILEDLLSDDELQVPSESIVYEAAMTWIKHDLPERQGYLSDLLKAAIRLKYLPKSYLTKVVAQEDLILTNHEAMHTFSGALQFKLGGTPSPSIVTPQRRRDHLKHKLVGSCEKIHKQQQEALQKQLDLGKTPWESWVEVHVNVPLHFLQHQVLQKYIVTPFQKLVWIPVHRTTCLLPQEDDNEGGQCHRGMLIDGSTISNNVLQKYILKPIQNSPCIPKNHGYQNEDYNNILHKYIIQPIQDSPCIPKNVDGENQANTEPIIPGVAKIGLFEKYILRPIAESPCIPDSDDEFEDDEDSLPSRREDNPLFLFQEGEPRAALQESVWTTMITDNHNPWDAASISMDNSMHDSVQEIVFEES